MGNSVGSRCLIPLHGNLARLHDHVSFGAAVLDNVAQDRDVLLAVGCDAVPLARTPPSYGLDSVAALRGAESVFGELVEFYAMPEKLVEFLVYIEGAPAQSIHRSVRAKYFYIEAIAVERDNMREGFELRDEIFRVLLEPAPEVILFVPGYGDGHAEPGDVRPSALYFVRQAQGFNVQVDFAIE